MGWGARRRRRSTRARRSVVVRGLVVAVATTLLVVGLPAAPRAVVAVLPVPDDYGALLAQSSSLIAHWDFDEPYEDPDPDGDDDVDTRTLQAAFGGIDAVAHGSTTLGQPGVAGNAVSMYAQGRWGHGYIAVGDHEELKTDSSDEGFAAEIWFRTSEDHPNQTGCLISYWSNGFRICHNQGELTGYVRTTGADIASTGDVQIATGQIGVNDGEWHHVVLSFTKGQIGSAPSEGSLYVDGETSEAWSDQGRDGTVNWDGHGLWIGVMDTVSVYTDNFWSGDLDEPALYDGPLDGSVINSHWETKPDPAPAQPPGAWNTGTYASLVANHAGVSHWTLDESSGSTFSDATGDNVATIADPGQVTFGGDAPYTLGGTSVDFTQSTSASAGKDDTLNPPNEMSVEAWVKVGLAEGGPAYGWGNHGFRLEVTDAGVPRLYARGQSWASEYEATNPDIRIDDNEWHHLVGVHNGTDLVLWVDGAQVDTSPMKEWIVYNDGAGGLVGGYGTWPSNLQYRGELDEVALYDHALTPVQVWSHIQAAGSDNCGGWSCDALQELAPGGTVPVFDTGRGADGQTAGDPVTTSTGNLTHNIRDLPPTEGLRGAAIERTYNSLDVTSGVFGLGWSSIVDVNLGRDLFEPQSRRVLRLPDGSRRTFSWDGDEWLADPGIVATMSESATGWEVTFSSGARWEFQKDGRLSALQEPNGSRIEVAWAPESEVLVSLTNLTTGWWVKLWDSIPSSGRVVKATDSGGREVVYGYTSGRLTSATRAAEIGSATSLLAETYSYDAAGRLLQVNDSMGRLVVANTYTTDGLRVIDKQTNPNGEITDFHVEYTAGADGERETTVTFSEGTADQETFTYVHNVAGSVVRIEDPEQQTVEKTYIGSRQLGSFENRLGDTWVRAYDPEGRLERIDAPSPVGGTLTSHTAYMGAGDGRPWITIAPDGKTTTYAYSSADPADVVPSQIWECGLQETTGNGISSADACPAGAPHTEIESDGQGRLTSITDPDGVATTYTYDGSGGLSCSGDQVCSVSIEGQVVASYSYDPVTGKVAQSSGPDSSMTTYDYDAWGQLIEVRDPLFDPGAGHYATNYGYNADGAIAWTSDPANPDTDGPTSGDGYLPSVHYTYWGGSFSGSSWVPEAIEGVNQPAGQLKDETRLIDQDTSTVATTRTRYTAAGWVASITEADDGDSELGSAEDDAAEEATTFNSYGPLGRLVKTVDPTGVQTHFCYDADGNQIKRAVGDLGANLIDCGTPQASLAVWSSEYDELGRVMRETDPDGVTVAYTYDAAGRVQTETRAPGQEEQSVTTYVYDSLGRLAQTKEDRGVDGDSDRPFSHAVVEERRYSDAGRIQVILRPPQDVLSFTWPADALNDANVLKEYHGYDSRGRLLCRVLSGGTPAFDGGGGLDCDSSTGAERFGYDDGDRVVCRLDPADVAVWVVSDEEVDCINSTGATRYEYDALGRTTRIYEPSPTGSGEVSQIRTYTPTGLLASETDFAVDPTQGGTPARGFTYLESGWLETAMDANGTGVEYRYDLRGNRIQRRSTTQVGSTPTSCGSSSVATCVLQGWTYDRADRLTSEIDGLGRATTFEYDFQDPSAAVEAGHKWQSADPSGRVEVVTWTAGGRRSEVVFDDGADSVEVGYLYDGQGRMTSMTDGDGVTEYAYDPAGNLVAMTLPDEAVVEWVWDLNGAVRRRAATTGRTLRFTHTKNYELSKVELKGSPYWLPLAAYTYDAAGREVHEALWTGGAYRDWDRSNAAGVVEEYDQLVSGVDLTTTLQWLPDGRVGAEVTDSACTVYTYDAAGQLDLVESADGDCASNRATLADYTHDGHGRRSASGSDDYAYDLADQLLGTGDDCALDAGGDPDADCDTTYTYDEAGRRLTVDGPDIETDYRWDPAGHLVELVQDNGTTQIDLDLTRDGEGTLQAVANAQFVWDPTTGVPQPVEADLDGGGSDVSYSYGLRRVEAGSGNWFAYDHLGSNLRRSVGPLPTLEPTSYEPFGEPVTDNDWPIYFGYRGELQFGLPQSPLVHLRNRDYDPDTGTFLTPDPMDGVDGTPTVANAYHYADNDPLNKTDPLGLRPLDCDLGMEKLHAAAEDSRLDGDRDRAVKITGIGAQSIKDDSCILDFSGVGDGLIVEAFGDLRTADNIAVMIEGQNQNIFNQSARPKAQGIRAEANRLPGGGSTASIAWLGYNSPDNYIDSIGRSKATTGGENLVAFVSGLRAKFPGKRIVTVGHSYGSVVVGEAMSRGLAANDAVVTGSPGINANSVAQTGFGGHLYVGAAPFDPVGQDPIGSNIHGPPPYSIPGARRLDIGGATGHNGYYNEGSTSLRSIASVVTGQVRYRGNRWGF